MSHLKLPVKCNHAYYGKRYSVPVVAWNAEGTMHKCLVCWDYKNNGWVEATLYEGPDPSDYPDLVVTKWYDPQSSYIEAVEVRK